MPLITGNLLLLGSMGAINFQPNAILKSPKVIFNYHSRTAADNKLSEI